MKLDRVIAVRNNKTVFRDGKRCVKIFSAEFSKPAIFAEALNHSRIEECVDFIPKLQEVIRHDRSWAIVYDFVKGKTLLQWMEEEPDALSTQVDFFVDIQLKLHKIQCHTLDSMQSRFLNDILQSPLDAELKYALRKGLEQMAFSDALCHADFVPSNVIVTDEGTPFVIDWGTAQSGAPLADAAITYLLLKIRGWAPFAECYLRTYLEKSHRSSEEIEQWLPFCAAYLTGHTNQAQRTALLPYVKSIETKGV